mmetsp:Transcript_20652/g.79157  ORF Transcript_20652/g.79157 Transcript_20652/m.79157 type:complete len:510 (-) Transcript_20652:808-2337(-)
MQRARCCRYALRSTHGEPAAAAWPRGRARRGQRRRGASDRSRSARRPSAATGLRSPRTPKLVATCARPSASARMRLARGARAKATVPRRLGSKREQGATWHWAVGRLAAGTARSGRRHRSRTARYVQRPCRPPHVPVTPKDWAQPAPSSRRQPSRTQSTPAASGWRSASWPDSCGGRQLAEDLPRIARPGFGAAWALQLRARGVVGPDPVPGGAVARKRVREQPGADLDVGAGVEQVRLGDAVAGQPRQVRAVDLHESDVVGARPCDVGPVDRTRIEVRLDASNRIEQFGGDAVALRCLFPARLRWQPHERHEPKRSPPHGARQRRPRSRRGARHRGGQLGEHHGSEDRSARSLASRPRGKAGDASEGRVRVGRRRAGRVLSGSAHSRARCASRGAWQSPSGRAIGHVQPRLAQYARIGIVDLAGEGDTGGGQLVELELGVRVPVGRRALHSLQQFVLRAPHRLAPARRVRRAQHELGAEEGEDAPRRVVRLEDQRHAGADQVRETEGG